MGRLTYGNGLITDRTYTAQNLRLATLKTGTTGTPTLLQNLSYTYYSAGNLDDITGTVRNASTGTNISANQSFVYDALDRLTSATGPYGTQTFTYSAIGNITNNSVLGAYTYGSKPHAVTQTGATTYTYDNNGNMSGGNGRTFAYDLDNRPTSITLSGVTTTMVYDASGSRVKKTVGSTTSVYIGDKYSCTVGGSCSRYIFAGSQRLAAMSGSSTYYYHGDHLGSTHVVTSSTQSPAQTVTYRPFGFTDVNVGSIDVRYKYTDQEIDDSTGFYYYKARYYAPLLARFIQPDTIVADTSNPQSINPYSYVNNNPMNLTDPTGHIPYAEGIFATPEDYALYNIFEQTFPGLSSSWNVVNPSVDYSGGWAEAFSGNWDIAGFAATSVASSGAWAISGAVGGTGIAGTATLGMTSLLTGDTQQDPRLYVTYTRTNYLTGNVYSGRSSGFEAPEEIVKNRQSSGDVHSALTSAGFANSTLDRFSYNDAAIRGREQQLIDYNGGAQSVGGTSANAINGISDWNMNRPYYMNEATREFGPLQDNSPNRPRFGPEIYPYLMQMFRGGQ